MLSRQFGKIEAIAQGRFGMHSFDRATAQPSTASRTQLQQ